MRDSVKKISGLWKDIYLLKNNLVLDLISNDLITVAYDPTRLDTTDDLILNLSVKYMLEEIICLHLKTLALFDFTGILEVQTSNPSAYISSAELLKDLYNYAHDKVGRVASVSYYEVPDEDNDEELDWNDPEEEGVNW